MIDREVPDEILDTWRAMGCSNADARRSLQYAEIKRLEPEPERELVQPKAFFDEFEEREIHE